MPTEELIRSALRAGDREQALEWFEYRLDEASRVRAVYQVWLEAMLEFGRAQVSGIDAYLERMTDLIGSPPLAENDSALSVEASAVRAALRAGDVAVFEETLSRLREIELSIHDDEADWCWGLLTVFRDALGEDALDEVFRVTQAPWLAERYGKLAEMTASESLELTVEGLRGHFSGRGRSGEVEVEERDDAWLLSFDPCGSGGRMRRGDQERGQAPRTQPPYRFGVTERGHDWSWQKEGVCLYCAHCAVVNEILPIEATGSPMRVVNYPESPNEPCRWTIYKSPELVPDEAFERVGKTRRH